MESTVLLDTNILIAAFRKNPEAIDFLAKKQYDFVISDITVMEIFAGCKTVSKRKAFEKTLAFYSIAPFTESVSRKAISLIKRYAIMNQPIHLPDMLIAATALNCKLPLKTFNKKDFEFIREIQLI